MRQPDRPLGWSYLPAVTGLAFSVLGLRHYVRLKVLGYLDALCSVNQWIQCDRAVVSRFAVVAGVPLGAWGVAFFLAALVGVALVQAAPGRSRPWAVRGLAAVVAV